MKKLGGLAAWSLTILAFFYRYGNDPLKEAERMSYKHNKTWRINNPQARNLQKKRNYAKGSENRNKKRRCWTEQEIKLILAQDRPCDRVLAEQLGRAVNAIQTKRSMLKKKAGNEPL